MELNLEPQIAQIKEYKEIKELFDKVREIMGVPKKDTLGISVEEIKRNMRKSLVVRKVQNGYHARIL